MNNKSVTSKSQSATNVTLKKDMQQKNKVCDAGSYWTAKIISCSHENGYWVYPPKVKLWGWFFGKDKPWWYCPDCEDFVGNWGKE